MFLLLKSHRLRQALGESEDQRHRVLGDNRAVNITSIGNGNVAGAEFIAHQRVHGGCGGVNPLQLIGSCDLLAAERPRDCDVGIGNFVVNAIVIVQMNDFELGKVVTKPFGEPRRRLPQIEAVMEDDEEFHKGSN